MTVPARFFGRNHIGRGRRRRIPRVGAIRVFVLCVSAVALFLVVLGGPSSQTAKASPTTTNSVLLHGVARSQVDALTAQARAVQAEIDKLDEDLQRAVEAYNHLSVRLDQINIRMAELRRELEQAQEDHHRHLERFEARIVGVYKAGGRDRLLQVLLLSSGIDDLIKRIRVVAKLAAQDHKLVNNVRDSSAALEALLRAVDEQKREELVIREARGEKRDQILAQLAEREETLARIDDEVARVIEQERVRQEAEQERLRQSLLGTFTGGRLYTGPLPQTGDPLIDQLVQTAATYMGIPYVWAGNRPSTGFDCSGFTKFVFAQHGVVLPHFSGYQARMGMPIEPSDARAGDLLAFGRPVYHVGIYFGDGYYIHAPRTGDVVRIEHLSEREDLSAIRRFQIQERIGPPAVR